MHTVKVEEIINKPINEVCNILYDVDNWKKLSKNFLEMTVLLREGDRHLTLQTTKHGREFKQYTLRNFKKNEIKFVHITPEFPLKQHYGEWLVEEMGKGKTKLILTHIFEIPFALIGKYLEKAIGKYFFMKNMGILLKDFKKGIENWHAKE